MTQANELNVLCTDTACTVVWIEFSSSFFYCGQWFFCEEIHCQCLALVGEVLGGHGTKSLIWKLVQCHLNDAQGICRKYQPVKFVMLVSISQSDSSCMPKSGTSLAEKQTGNPRRTRSKLSRKCALWDVFKSLLHVSCGLVTRFCGLSLGRAGDCWL